MRTLKPYPSYKDSGITWLGNVPEHWRTRATKRLLREISDKGYPDLPLLAATQSMGVVRKERYGQRTVMAMTNLESLKRVQVDDFVISLRSFQGGIERAHDEGILSSAYTVLRHDRRLLDVGYLARLFKSKPFLSELELNVTGIREGQNINYSSLRETHLPLPPLDEQRAIADFLDGMDSRITQFIAARRKMIARLEEKKQAVINQAVIRGLEFDVPLRDSGVDWLGEIPVHWQLRRLKHLVKEVSDKGYPQLPLLAATQTMGVVTKDRYGQRTVLAMQNLESLKRVCVGDFVISLRSFQGGIERAYDEGIISSAYTVLRHDQTVLDGSYLARLFKSRSFIQALELSVTGIREGQNINYDELREELLPIPPMDEQKRIVAALGSEVSGIEHLAERYRREIELMQEYRTRLISDVVTGELDVRGVKLPAVEEVIGEEIEAAMEDEDVEALPAFD